MKRVLFALIASAAFALWPMHSVHADPQPWKKTFITTNTGVNVAAGHAVLGAMINTATVQQPAGECDIYDANGAISGNIVYAENGIGAGQVITFGESGTGVDMTNGIYVICGTAPTGGIEILWRQS